MCIRLSNRESEVLRLILSEKSTKEISDILKISPRTIETHRKNIMRKTGSGSLIGLTLFGVRKGYLEGYKWQSGNGGGNN